jgi:hypothetical protein
MADALHKTKDELFKQLLDDSKEKVQDGINHWVYLLSVAFEYGFEQGYEKGFKDSTSSDILPVAKFAKSDNVE